MESDLRNMVMAFRVTELQTLLNYAGKNRSGRKNELQQRALELIKGKPGHIVMKVRELYRTIQLSTMSQPAPASAGVSNNHSSYSTASGMTRLYTGSTGYAGASDKVLQGRSPFSSYNGIQPKIPGLTPMSLPICPDVRLKRLPFYDILSELIKPTSLIPHGGARLQESSYPFYLTPQQAADVASSKEYTISSYGEQKIQYCIQLQLRFCLSEANVDQEDCFPPSILVKVNGKNVPLPHPIPSNRPGVEPKRPSRPLNVTNYAKLSPTCPNTVSVQWAPDTSKTYTVSLYLVKKLCSADLLQRLKTKGARPSDYTRGMIKEIVMKDEADCIATTSFKVSIACPLGKCRMTLPCRASTCSHLQCFDANLYLQMNEKKPSWNCPVCDKSTLFDNISIDGYFQDVLKKMEDAPSANDIEILPDGSWTPMVVKIEADDCGPPLKRKRHAEPTHNQTICIDDDLIIEDEVPARGSVPHPPQNKNDTIVLDVADNESDCAVEETKVNVEPSSSTKQKLSKSVECIDLTIESSEEEEEEDDEEETKDSKLRPREEEEESIGRKLRPRSKKSNYIDDDTTSTSSKSSASSTTNEGSIALGPRSVEAAPASPACITLGSPSPSPELSAEQQSNSNDGQNTNTTFSTYSSFQKEAASSSGSSVPTFGGNTALGHYNTRQSAQSAQSANSGSSYTSTANDVSNSVGSSTYPSQTPQGYVQYGNWNTQQQTYQGGTNYGTLDFQSLDYYNQSTYSTPGGTGGGYNNQW